MGVKIRTKKLIRWSFAGAFFCLGGASLWAFTDRFVESSYDRYRLQFESQLSEQLGHPLVIGPYKGLRGWGIAIGETKILTGSDDDSSANLSGLNVQFAPIASFLNLRPVAIFSPKGASILLKQNEKGSYWVFGKTKKTVAPNIDLRLRIADPIRVAFPSSNFEVKATARTSFKLSEKKIVGSVLLDLPDKGKLSWEGSGYWDRLNLEGRAKIKALNLEPLKKILPVKLGLETQGRVDGDFQLGIKKGNFSCKGGLEVSNLLLKGGFLRERLSSNGALINCSEDLLEIPTSKWEYGPWKASLKGSLPVKKADQLNLNISSSIGLKEVVTPGLKVTALLPIFLKEKGFNTGELIADLSLESFPLSPLSNLFGTPIAGTLSAEGQIKGAISDIGTDLSLKVINPQFGGIRLQEEWQGKFVGLARGGGSLKMQSVGAAVPGDLLASFRSDWSLDDVTFNRLGGKIHLKNNENTYAWKANGFRLDRVEVAIPPERSFKRIFGELAGSGTFELNPFSFKGQVLMSYPRLMGIRLKSARLNGSLVDSKYSIKGRLLPSDNGELYLNADGFVGGSVKAKADVNNVSARWLTRNILQLSNINLETSSVNGKAKDLGELIIEAISGSIDAQLKELTRSQYSVRKNLQFKKKENIIDPEDLTGNIDASIELVGPEISKLDLTLKLSGNLKVKGQKEQEDFNLKPLKVTLSGPLYGGIGNFSLVNIPFSILSLFSPIPSSLSGFFGVSGNYRLGKNSSSLKASLTLEDAKLADNPFTLQRGNFLIKNSVLELDVAIKNSASLETITFVGTIPLNSTSQIDLRIESHGDALRFLDGLSNGLIDWKTGTADLRLYIRGTLSNPEANGFLVVNSAELVVMERRITDLNSTLLFDFNRLEVLNLNANIGSKGTIDSSGAIALFNSNLLENRPLLIKLSGGRVKLPIGDIQIASSLVIKGALVSPVIGGQIDLKEGSLSPLKSKPKRNNLSPKISNSKSSNKLKEDSLPEQAWDRSQPLVLFIRDEDSLSSKILKTGFPESLSFISFKNLRLKLGPDLRIVSMPLASFNIDGLLTFNGAFDPSLKASGVVRLISGRVNLFTTTFSLDTREPNVAIFVPSMGLIPYVDVKMKSRVSDNIKDASNLASSSDFASNGSGSIGYGGARFVKVEVIANGPADRVSENFQLRSTPSMPRSQLLGLIGGNSLSRLLDGGEREVLVNVLNRSLISPMLGNLSGAFNEKLQLSIYPIYVNGPEIGQEGDNSQSASSQDPSGQLSPQQAWVTEMGIDLTDRVNFSVQATPNRNDIPPQGTLAFQFNQNIGVLGSFDKNGSWQSQLQLYMRY